MFDAFTLFLLAVVGVFVISSLASLLRDFFR